MTNTHPTPIDPPRVDDAPRISDHLLDAYGDLFCKHNFGRRLKISFEQFLIAPHYYLRLRRYP